MNKRAISQVKMSIVIIIVVVAVAAGAYLAIRPSGSQVESTMSTVANTSVPNPDTLVVETLGQPDSLDPATAYTIRDTPVTQNVFE
ncbi:MAG TPA: hypothetical protein VLV31_06165, partial [Candidatus Acidoferrales bacterium]|nr:hypothetical protein [Candidatus Acidoferrales bacterium]